MDLLPQRRGDAVTPGTCGPGVVLGTRVGPFEGRLDATHLESFAAATNDRTPGTRAGSSVPPMAVVTLLWEPQGASRPELVPARLQDAATGGVHGEHDVVLHRPVVLDESLTTWVEGSGARPAGPNSVITLRYLDLRRPRASSWPSSGGRHCGWA